MKYPRRRFLVQSHTMSYQEFWDRQSETVEAAIRAVDGSSDETTVQLTGKWTANQVAHALDLQAGDSILELGCGVGRIGRELAARCAHWVGSDISPNMLKAAYHRLAELDNVEFAQLERSSFQGLFADDSFDKAYSVAVFCHMDKEDLFLYLRDLHRIIRPGGLIYIETWNLAHPVGWRRWEHEVRNWSRLAAGERKMQAVTSSAIRLNWHCTWNRPALSRWPAMTTVRGSRSLQENHWTALGGSICVLCLKKMRKPSPIAKFSRSVSRKPWTFITAKSKPRKCSATWIPLPAHRKATCSVLI
jgi:ubiquinone/menaquinone biosynthesis C-methylase UbiE